MAERVDIINSIGREYLTTNTESGEWSYPKAFKDRSLEYVPIKNSKTGANNEILDIRFVKDNVTVLVETKTNFNKDLKASMEQLSAYVALEKKLTNNKVVAILANTDDEQIKVWRGVLSDDSFLEDHYTIRSMAGYTDLFAAKINNKELVMSNTYRLNEMLHKHGIAEKLRSQFVGTCLLALKNGLDSEYESPVHNTNTLLYKIREVLEGLLEGDMNRAKKLTLLDEKVLSSQDIREIDISGFREIMRYIDKHIRPFINDKSTMGQDLLNLFFTTFNKYVGKADKNQAFTPDHITDFMAKVARVGKNTRVLDPCAGSGAFLVRSMMLALDDCVSEEEQDAVKKNHIYGIEFEEKAYGLVTTNMLIHSDGNSNIKQGSCFNEEAFILEASPDVVLMNPPFNAQKKHMPKVYTDTWGKKGIQDPSKGLYFVKYILDTLKKANKRATVAVILPVACAIGSSGVIGQMKEAILHENTLDAVFTLPNEVFYPGASASTCCMVFKTSQSHKDSPDTFFGYFKEDGFKKKKNLGRVEQINPVTGESLWVETLELWLDLYRNRRPMAGLSAVQKVTGKDEWLCEAYMETDYSTLTEADFQTTLNNYLSYLVKEGHINEA